MNNSERPRRKTGRFFCELMCKSNKTEKIAYTAVLARPTSPTGRFRLLPERGGHRFELTPKPRNLKYESYAKRAYNTRQA